MAQTDGATAQGLSELQRAITRLPQDVTRALQAVALRTARRVRTDARRLLLAQTHGTGATAAAIEILEDLPNKQYRVISEGPRGKPKNLGLWIENGTRHQPARPYMRPARDAAEGPYKRESLAAAQRIAVTLESR
jgi:hypothetical protein